MTRNWQKKYHIESDLSEAYLDDRNSLKKMLRLVGENKLLLWSPRKEREAPFGVYAPLRFDRGGHSLVFSRRPTYSDPK